MDDVLGELERANNIVRSHVSNMYDDHYDRADRVIEQQTALSVLRVGEALVTGDAEANPTEGT